MKYSVLPGNYLLISSLLQIARGYLQIPDARCVNGKFPDLSSYAGFQYDTLEFISQVFNGWRSKIATGTFNVSWLAGTMIPNLREVGFSPGLSLGIGPVLICFGDRISEVIICQTISRNFESLQYNRPSSEALESYIHGSLFQDLYNLLEGFSSLQDLCKQAGSPDKDYLLFLCMAFNPYIARMGCSIAKEFSNWNFRCNMHVSEPLIGEDLGTGAREWLFINFLPNGLPCSQCGNKRCSPNFFGLCSINDVYKPVRVNRTTIIYVSRTYPTLPPPPKKKERFRRNRHLVRKAVKQRIRWADVYGPDFIPNPLFMLYKTIATRKTTTTIRATTTPPPSTGVEIYVPQPSEKPKGEAEEPQPVPQKRKPRRKHEFAHKDHPVIEYHQPDYSSGLISLGTNRGRV